MNNTIYLLLFSASLILATYLYLTSSKKLFSRLNALALLLSAGVMVTEWGIYNADSYHDVVYYDSFRVVFIGAVACVLGICAFLFARPFEHHPKEKLINQTVSTILVVSCMGAIFFNELEGVVTILSNKINGKWYYALHSGNFYGQFMVGWYFFILVVMSASFYLSCYKSKVDGEKKWKLGLFVGFLAYGLMMFLVFIWQPDGDSPSSFDMAPYLFVLVSGLGWVYSKFNLFELSLKDAMNEILESVSNLVIITDAKFVVKYKNELASEVLFLKKEKASYSIIQVLRGAEEIDVDKFVKKVKALPYGEKYEDHFTLMIDGLQKNYFLVVSKIVKKENHAGYSFVAMDISTIVEKEQELKSNNQELEHTNKELERFAYIASHDLKTPLRNIISFLSLLKRKFKNIEDPEVHEFMNIVDFNAQSMHHLIEEILEYSLVKSTEIKMTKVDMNQVLFLIEKNLSNYLDEKDAIIKYGDLPIIEANHHQMVQLFQNLIENGLKYNTSPSPKVTISIFQENEYLVFKIEDNGIGISPEYHKTVFEIFKRLHNQSEYQGSGVGLAICNKIVTNHGGYIELISVENVGSIFMVNLKVKVYEEAALLIET